MQIIETPKAMQAWALKQKQSADSIAFVPTMGNLHAGHLALVEEAKRNANKIVVSIFVNPLQFGPNEDLDKYPRTFEADKQKLEAMDVDVLFFPQSEDMYPLGKAASTKLIVPGVTDILCGKQRPGHFDGVTTVVAKLFNLVQPDIAVFGEKDYQQLFIIRRMVADQFMPIEILSLATVRESDGLAMSSRNGYLSLEERQIAPILYKTLVQVKNALISGENLASVICKEASERLSSNSVEVEYLEARKAEDLQLIENKLETDAVVFLAVRVGHTRLIDNIVISLK